MGKYYLENKDEFLWIIEFLQNINENVEHLDIQYPSVRTQIPIICRQALNKIQTILNLEDNQIGQRKSLLQYQ